MIAVIDCGGANLRSVSFALENLNIDYQVCKKKEQVINSNAMIIPGVGAAKNVMSNLKKQNLINAIKEYKKPVLGICVGMQIFYEFSEEENEKCLGLIPGKIKKFSSENNLTIPHMGWNEVVFNDDSFDECDGYYYFANSYYAEVNKYTFGKCSYGNTFSAFVRKDNFFGVQFHPEKSSKKGSKFLMQFLKQL